MTKMYVLWSKKVFYAIAVHPVSENPVLLDQDTLNTILTFMKASPKVEQLLVQFEADMAEVVAKWEILPSKRIKLRPRPTPQRG